MKFTISMACYDDFDGVYFTVQALRAYHDLTGMDLLVLDNHPDSAHGERLRSFAPRAGIKLVAVTDRASSWVKYDAIQHATGDVVVGMDSHVLLLPGALQSLRAWWQAHEGARDLLTGPIVYDELDRCSTHLEPRWQGHDFGVWSPVIPFPAGDAFEVPMQGMGFWSVWRAHWPCASLAARMRGFGAEEWTVAESIRQHGGRVMSHPALLWTHRFGWPKRTFPLTTEDKVRNYFRGWLSLYHTLDHPRMQEMIAHWETKMPAEKLQTLIRSITP